MRPKIIQIGEVFTDEFGHIIISNWIISGTGCEDDEIIPYTFDELRAIYINSLHGISHTLVLNALNYIHN